jgi:hypothetical protein
MVPNHIEVYNRAQETNPVTKNVVLQRVPRAPDILTANDPIEKWVLLLNPQAHQHCTCQKMPNHALLRNATPSTMAPPAPLTQ